MVDARSIIRRWNQPAVLTVLVLVLMSGLWAATLGTPLFLDDMDELRHVRSFDGITDALVRPDCYGFFRPLKNVAFLAIARAGRFGPVLRHGMTWGAYLLAGVLLMQYAYRLLRNRGWGALCVLVWAVAPTQVSCLAWFSCINILWMTVFILGGLLLYDTGMRQATFAGRTRRGLAAVCFFVAVLSYEGGIAFPALLVLHDRLRARAAGRQAWVRYGGFVLVALAAVAVRLGAAGNLAVGGEGFSPMTALQVSFASAYFFLDHLALWCFPVGRQEVLGAFVWGESVPVAILAIAWLMVLCVAALLYALWRRAPLVGFGLSWYAFAFAPMSNLVPLRNGPFADYYLVLPSIGFAIALVAGAARIADSMRRMPRDATARKAALAVLVCLALWRGAMGLVAINWAMAWKQPGVVLHRSVNAGPYAFRARANLARLLMRAGDLETARLLAERAAAEAPWYDLTYNVLGDIAVRQEAYAAACAHYRSAIAAAPGSPYPHYALAYVMETHLEQPHAAATAYACVLALPWNAYSETAALNLSRLHAIDGRLQEAIRIIRAALREVPASPDLQHNLRVALRQQEAAASAEPRR